MAKLEGYRTILAMVVALVAALLQYRGIIVPESDQAAFATGMMAVVGIVLRLVTKGPAGRGGAE